jgi:hypothetical protein
VHNRRGDPRVGQEVGTGAEDAGNAVLVKEVVITRRNHTTDHDHHVLSALLLQLRH